MSRRDSVPRSPEEPEPRADRPTGSGPGTSHHPRTASDKTHGGTEPRGRSRPRLPPRKRAAQPVREAAQPAPAETTVPRGRADGRTSRRPALIFLAVALMVVGTVAFRTWMNRRQDLPRVAEVGKTEGIPALEEGKFDKAYQLLSAAREAVDSLGGAVEDADEIRHAADEASIFVDLIPDTLENLLDEAARTTPQTWATRFDNLYKGRAVIIDARIIASPESGGSQRYELDYLVFPPGRARISATPPAAVPVMPAST